MIVSHCISRNLSTVISSSFIETAAEADDDDDDDDDNNAFGIIGRKPVVAISISTIYTTII